jgi:hypothetical protein
MHEKLKQKEKNKTTLLVFNIFIKHTLSQGLVHFDTALPLFSTCRELHNKKKDCFKQQKLIASITFQHNFLLLPEEIQKGILRAANWVTSLTITHMAIKASVLKNLLKKFHNLTALNLQESIISDSHLRYLSSCKKLQSLDISLCENIHTQALQHLEGIPLQALNLLECREIELTQKELPWIGSVRWLNLEGTRTTNETVQAITEALTELEELILNRCSITDAAATCLFTHKRLRVLHLNNCKQVTPKIFSTAAFRENTVLETVYFQKKAYHFPSARLKISKW